MRQITRPKDFIRSLIAEQHHGAAGRPSSIGRGTVGLLGDSLDREGAVFRVFLSDFSHLLIRWIVVPGVHERLQAVIAALKKVESEILKDHISHCVEHAISSGNKKAQREKVEELVATLSRSR